MDNVKYCGYCDHHFQKINKKLVKTIPAFRPASGGSEEAGSPTATPDKNYPGSGGGAAKETAAKPQLNASSAVAQCNSKGKGKRGRKPGSMIYEPKLEPPKFNPDLASLNQSNNSLNSVNNSVTLTPVSNFNNINNHKSVNSFSNSETGKLDRNLNDKVNNKTPNVVVKLGKHGEVHHAKKDSPHDNPSNSSPSESEAILERVTSNSDVKEEVIDKKGFTTANFTESFLPSSSVSVTASLIKHGDTEKHSNHSDKAPDTSRVKLEAPETLDAPSASSVSLVSVSGSGEAARSQQLSSGYTRDTEQPDTTQKSLPAHNLIPQYKGDLKTTGPSQNTFNSTLESQASAMKSSNSIPNSSGSMFTRTSLHSSVSLFPTGSNHASSKLDSSNNSQPHTTVSIIPSVTSNCSSTTLSSASSSLTVTPVDSSSGGSGERGGMANNVTKHGSEAVTISSVANDDRLTLETLNQSKNGAINPQNSKVEKVGNGPVKRMGRPPKKGTHTTTSSLANVINIESEEEDPAGPSSGSKRPRIEDAEKVEEKVVKKEDSESGFQKFMMFGATLNPASRVAKEMSSVLQVRGWGITVKLLSEFCYLPTF